MNESPWQPPTDGEPERVPVPGPEPLPAPAPTTAPDASPWSPEGAGSWGAAEPVVGAHVPPPSGSPVPPPPGTPLEPAVVARAEQPAPPERRRSKLVVAGAVAAVGALGLAGLFAVQRMSGESAGGAASADELGNDLMAAIEAEDVLGVIDTMLPGERDALGDPFVEMVGELQRLEVLSADTDLSKLLGLDVELTGETVQVRGTNVPDIVNVSLAADASITLDGATLPIGSFIEEQLPDDALTELRGTRLTETDQLELELTAVQDGDRWYFSLFHTLAELARTEAGDEPIPVEGVPASGADSPEAAVDRLLDAVEQLDLRGVIATLDPAEAAALQRYAPLFLDEAEAELAEVPLEWRVDVREFRVDGDGGERTVFVDAIGISGELEGAPFTVGFSDGCVRAEFDGDSFEECGTSADEELESLFAEAPAVEAFATTVEGAFADIEPIGIELRERDGAWFVSPFATVTEALLAAMRALDRDELDLLVTDGTAAAEEFFEVFLGGFGLDDIGALEEDFVFDEPVDEGSLDEGTVEEGTLEPGSDDETAETAWDECYGEVLAADAAACFQRYVEAGEIDRVSVPASLLHPECGLAELSWEGGLYTASDAEFAATLEVAVPCFEALVAGGEIEEWMLPFEVLYAECFEGRNWYDEFDDDAYNERVDACIAATG